MVQYKKPCTFKTSVLKLSLAAVIYHIWCERNHSIFRRQRLSSGDLIAKIHDDLHNLLERCGKDS